MSRRALLSITMIALMAAAGLGARWWMDSGERPAPAPGALALEGLDRLADAFPGPGDEPLAWPRDHGSRPEQSAESWLFAGLLDDGEGGRYGFQFAFYRLAVSSDAPDRDSAWATRDVYRARLSVEPAGDPARAAERLSRGALGLADARPAPVRAWLENWSFEHDAAEGGFVLRAADPGLGLELHLRVPETLPVPVDGELYRGYWWPGLGAEGTLLLDGRHVPVAGRAMLDRLWGRVLPAGRGQLALARLWLEDGDGAAIRCERLQRRSGGGTPRLECLGHPAAVREIAMEPVGEGWHTVAGIRFPLRWELRSSSHEQPLLVAPLSPRRPLSFDASWSGVVAGGQQAWGVLELSNFTAP